VAREPRVSEGEAVVDDGAGFEQANTGLCLLSRSPMTIAEITALRGIVGYVAPARGSHWLTLRLADGAWVRVAPAESDLEFYLIEPADELAVRRGIQPQFVALWAAYRNIGRIALAAMERAANAGTTHTACPIAGMDVVEVLSEDHTMPAMKLLAQLASTASPIRHGALSMAGNLAGEVE